MTIKIKLRQRIVFVSDFFKRDLIGGAELTTNSLIEFIKEQFNSIEIVELNSKSVTQKEIENYQEDLWVLCNTSQLSNKIASQIVHNVSYATIDYDYRFCKYRSCDLHKFTEKSANCNCGQHFPDVFYDRAVASFWMSEAQRQIFAEQLPSVARKIKSGQTYVMSSVFSRFDLQKMKQLSDNHAEKSKNWIVLNSQSWLKGTNNSINYCKENNLPYELVSGLSHWEFLTKIANSQGLVYIALGDDTCPRMIIESVLVGSKCIINDKVQHANEDWFKHQDKNVIFDYLSNNSKVFTDFVKRHFEPKISGYVTTYNCIRQGYPLEECITSLMGFCDEVCIVDSGSSDETLEKIWNLQRKYLTDLSYACVLTDCYSAVPNEKTAIKLKTVKVDWDDERSAVNDGLLKAEARRMCSGDYCWQMDVDEIVHEDDYVKVKSLVSSGLMNRLGANIMCLPVIEYWGGPEKVRVDVIPWKWRISKNLNYITHGIPKHLRRYDSQNRLYAEMGTDGCDMIHAETYEPLPNVNFFDSAANNLRNRTLLRQIPTDQYQEYVNSVIKVLPGVHHYSWYNIERKIKTYKTFWTKFWNSLYAKNIEDTAENNMMFDVPWSDVDDEMIAKLAKRLKLFCGGWIWHSKWTGYNTPSISVNRSEPAIMIKK